MNKILFAFMTSVLLLSAGEVRAQELKPSNPMAEQAIFELNYELAFAEQHLKKLTNNYTEAVKNKQKRIKSLSLSEISSLNQAEKDALNKYTTYRNKVYQSLSGFEKNINRGVYNAQTLDLIESIEEDLGLYKNLDYATNKATYLNKLRTLNKYVH